MFVKVRGIPSRLFREIIVSRSTPRTSPSLFTMLESLVGYTATWSPDSYLVKQKTIDLDFNKVYIKNTLCKDSRISWTPFKDHSGLIVLNL